MKHEAFMLGTSKGKHNHKGFDLFITTAPIPDLNEKLIVFGQVIKGEDVVQVTEFTLFMSCLHHCVWRSVLFHFPFCWLIVPFHFPFPISQECFFDHFFLFFNINFKQ